MEEANNFFEEHSQSKKLAGPRRQSAHHRKSTFVKHQQRSNPIYPIISQPAQSQKLSDEDIDLKTIRTKIEAALRDMQSPASNLINDSGALQKHEILENKRYFGEFRCVCGREWRSGNTWKDLYQNCQKCQRKTYPHTQVKRLKYLKPNF